MRMKRKEWVRERLYGKGDRECNTLGRGTAATGKYEFLNSKNRKDARWKIRNIKQFEGVR